MFSFTNFLLFLALAIGLIYIYFKRSFNYWKNKKLTSVPPRIPFGNLEFPIRPKYPLHELVGKLYDLVKSKNEIHGGFYFMAKPVYIPIDPELLRHVMSLDFNHFQDRGVIMNEKTDPLSAHLFSLPGQKWRILRTKLTPTFTSGKMKNMFFIMLESAKNMIKHIDEEFLPKEGLINVKEVMGCFTTDVIGSAAFGLDCNSFKDTDSAFRYYGKKVFKGSILDQLRVLFCFFNPKLATLLRLNINRKDVNNFFTNLTKKTLEYREKNNIVRKDFLQLLIDMKNSEENSLTFNEIAAQCFLFFLAGFETSSTTMTFALYELALNLEIQEKAREEVKHVLKKYNGEVTYDGIMEMKYLQQIIDETLRKYPALTVINRKVTKTYKVPNTDVVLDEGTLLFIPVYSLQHDPNYYPDPEKFDPDRFSEERKQTMTHFTYMPFGEGPRNCIGIRFGVLQAKIGLCLLLKKYIFTMNALTKVPVELDPETFVIASKHDIILNVKKIN